MDARRDGVVLPARFRAAPQLILEIGLRMVPPITDLDLTDIGVQCTLSFAKQPFLCTLPWTSIWALIGKRDGRGYQWVEDIPPELVAVPQPPPPPRMPVALRAVSAVTAEAPEPPPAEASAPPEAASTEEAEKPASPEKPAEEGLAAAADQGAPEPEKEAEKIEEPPVEEKKKRPLPSYLRVIK